MSPARSATSEPDQAAADASRLPAASRRQYSRAFRREVARLIRDTGARVDEISIALGVSASTVRSWLEAFERDDSGFASGFRRFTNSSLANGAALGAPDSSSTDSRDD